MVFPAYALEDKCNDRICQFRIVEKMQNIRFETVSHLNETCRGGFGSTGKN